MPDPHLILRIPQASIFVYASQENKNYKTWINTTLMQILKQETVPLEYNSLGKPILPNELGYVNWSTSKNKCVLVYSKERKVGIDLEFYKERNFESISKRFFSENECTNNAKEFYLLWTKKEAYYKCMGKEFFSILKNDCYPNAKIWNLQGPYREKHEMAICVNKPI